jgi:hypothetical protein
MDSAARPDTVPLGPDKDPLLNLLVERHLRARAFPTKYVGYIDMLGFGALVRAHPGAFNVDVDTSTSAVSTSTSKSSERFGRFHAVLDRMAMDAADASRPERMMIFSDCAFALYDNALQAAVSLSQAMRRFLEWVIPVRMCIAKGTCHAERFSIESFPTFNLTRSMFYGSGIVFAVQGEENAGKGCRIFLSTSLDEEDKRKIESRMTVLPLPAPSPFAEFELNYLNEANSDGPDPSNADLSIFVGLTLLRGELRDPIDPEVRAQYDESFALFNRMRTCFGRYEIPAPRFDGAGNLLDLIPNPSNSGRQGE